MKEKPQAGSHARGRDERKPWLMDPRGAGIMSALTLALRGFKV